MKLRNLFLLLSAGALALGIGAAQAQTNPGTSPLSVAKGGSGLATLANHGVIFGAGASPLTTYVCTGFLVGTGGTIDPTCRSIAGADLPAPTASVLGGIKSLAATSHQWIDSISTAGLPHQSQPAFSDISGAAASAQIPAANLASSANGGVTGNLPVTNLNGGTGASSSSYWRGDGVWGALPGGGNVNAAGTLTNHAVVVGTGSTNVATIAAGTTGQCTVSGGASADPAMTSGCRVLLNTLTASNSTSLSDTTSLSATYSAYDVEFTNLVTGTNEAILELALHSGGTFKTTGYLGTITINGGTASVTTYIPMGNVTVGPANATNAIPGYSGLITFYNPSASTIIMVGGYSFWISQGGTASTGVFNGVWNTSGAIDGFQVCFATTGTTCLTTTNGIVSGTIKVYGRL